MYPSLNKRFIEHEKHIKFSKKYNQISCNCKHVGITKRKEFVSRQNLSKK